MAEEEEEEGARGAAEVRTPVSAAFACFRAAWGALGAGAGTVAGTRVVLIARFVAARGGAVEVAGRFRAGGGWEVGRGVPADPAADGRRVVVFFLGVGIVLLTNHLTRNSNLSGVRCVPWLPSTEGCFSARVRSSARGNRRR